MKRKIYGWVEQNAASWGIEVREIDLDDYEEGQIVFDKDGSVYGDVPHGIWFSSFSHAKRAAIAEWTDTLKTARCALRDIRRLKKSDAYVG